MQAPPSMNLPSIDSKLAKTPSSGSPLSVKKVTPVSTGYSSTYRLPQSMEHLANDSFTGKQLLLQQSSIKSLPSSSYIRELFVQKYALGRILGRGASAEVFEAKLKNASPRSSNNYPFAVKIIRRDNRMNDNTTMATELEILRRVNHAHVIQLVEVFETRDSLFLVMERAQGGDLISALANLPVYSESAVREVFRQLLEAVEYLHSLGIVHRDLKLDNLLYDTIPTCSSLSNDETDDESTVDTSRSSTTAAAISVKVADFGLSALLPAEKESKKNWFNYSSSEKRDKRLTEMWGTTEYFAPEVYERHYGRQADVWALGCILFEMLTGEIAFPYKETPVGFVERLLFHGGSKPQRVFERKAGWQKLSPEAQSLIKKMLKVSPVKRLSVSECLRHPFFTKNDSKVGLKHVDSVASVQTSLSESILSEEDHSDTVVLTEAQRVLKDRVLRRQRRYAHLLAEVAARHSTNH